MRYLDPAPESGIAVNFGTTDTGQGNIQPTEAIKSAPKVTTPPPTAEPEPEVKEDVVTQDTEDAPVIKKEEKEVVKTETPVKKDDKISPVINNLGQKTLTDTMKYINSFLFNEIK